MTGSGSEEDRLMTAKEAARYLGYAEGTVRNKASSGEIPSVKLGTALRFRRSELDRWVDEQTALARGESAVRPCMAPKDPVYLAGLRDAAKRREGDR